MESFESKYNKLIEEYDFYADECYEDGSPILESIFVGFCNSFANNLRDMGIREIKHKFEDFEKLSKLMAYKHLKENKENVEDLEYLLDETL